LIDNLEVGHGVGSSKKEAEQRAAQSVSHEPSDEECARMLDRLDKMSK
jgi:ribonuclease-3